MIAAQEWLKQKYPNKEQVKIIEFADEAEGELTIEDFPKLEELKKKTEGEKNITKLTIINCPLLRRVNCYFCWEIKELVISNCPQINEINCDSNQIENLELSELENLTFLNCSNNLLTNLNVRNNRQLIRLSCEKNKLQTIDLRNNPRITSLDINDNPLIHSPYFFSKKQRSKMKDLQNKLNLSEQILVKTVQENNERTTVLEHELEGLKFSLVEEQNFFKREQEKNQKLCQNISALQEKNNSDGQEKIRLAQQIKELVEKNQKFRTQLFQWEIKNREEKLNTLVNVIKSELNEDDKEELEILIEAQVEFVQSGGFYAQKQLEKSQKRLLKNKVVSQKEIEKILQMQIEIINLQREAEVENLIEVPPK